ncbi:MAG: hypothetical protein K6E77_09800 [Lachnospiraceae bacterium]|nr:hypothetical protein [Lachnospiraceae bacterium]
MNNSKLCELAKKQENRGNIRKAYQLYLEAAMAEDDGEAMYALAQMYFEGDYVSESYDKAGRYFGMAYDQKANIEPWTLILAGGYWQSKDPFIAIKYYQVAADQGILFGNDCIGEIYFEMGQYDKAHEYLLKMDGTNPCGFYYMGRLYEDGLGIEKDLEKAIFNYRKAAWLGQKFEEMGCEDDYCVKAKLRLNELGIDSL